LIEITARDGWIVKQGNLAVDKKEKREKVIQLADQLNPSVVARKERRNLLNGLLGRKSN
jgi:uncharacterized protein YjhX (UPF0386 family)